MPPLDLERDRFGLGFRPELAAGILAHLDRLDFIEVIADDWFDAPPRRARALRTLATQVPIVLHGVGLGLASAAPADDRRIYAMARLVNAVEPAFWSEHLAFVRSPGDDETIEIGHLAAPPRTEATVEGALKNLDRAARACGSRPRVENIATLVMPPGSRMDEAAWVSCIVRTSGCDLLLDLHNLYANAINFGRDPFALLASMPLDRVAAVHLAGGRYIPTPAGGRRLLDDHMHDAPEPVYALLAALGARTARPLAVLVERDGRYPPVEQLLGELDRARAALARGRARTTNGEVA